MIKNHSRIVADCTKSLIPQGGSILVSILNLIHASSFVFLFTRLVFNSKNQGDINSSIHNFDSSLLNPSREKITLENRLVIAEKSTPKIVKFYTAFFVKNLDTFVSLIMKKIFNYFIKKGLHFFVIMLHFSLQLFSVKGITILTSKTVYEFDMKTENSKNTLSSFYVNVRCFLGIFRSIRSKQMKFFRVEYQRILAYSEKKMNKNLEVKSFLSNIASSNR